jgi:alkanesulfonate monooxygenase SsuD/methylene tetrahydromethanopterin reductase-like flavin-dependent oxidoreductase (luciferase family)
LKFGLEINEFDWPGGEAEMGRHLAEIGGRAERAGFHSLWVWDHFIQLRRWEDPLLEGWLTLATSRPPLSGSSSERWSRV